MISVRVNRNPFDVGGFEEFQAEASTVGEALALIDGVSGDEPFLKTYVHGKPVSSIDDLHDGDLLNVVVEPGTGLEAPTYLLIAQIVIGAASLIVSALMFKKPNTTRARGDDSSPTYNFTGISQTRVEHQPIEVVFGENRMGGTVISEYITSTYAPVTSTLHQLISYGHGPYFEIAGQTEDTAVGVELPGAMLPGSIFINDNPIENYDDVFVQVRMGTPDQEPIDGFEQIREVKAVGPFEMTSEETTLEGNTALTDGFDEVNFFDGTNDLIWDEFGRTFDLTTEYDELVLRLNAPQGYYSSSSGGDLLSSAFKYQVRYRELDTSNNPITTGGIALDGWYREQLNSGIGFPVFSQQGSFDYEIRVPLFDPQTSTVPEQGGSYTMALDSTVDWAEAAVDSPPMSVGAGYEAHSEAPFGEGFSVSMWVKLDDGSGSLALSENQKVFLCGTADPANHRGWSAYLQLLQVPADYGGTQLAYVISMQVERSGGSNPETTSVVMYVDSHNEGIPLWLWPSGWNHLAISFGRSRQDDNKVLINAWINGVRGGEGPGIVVDAEELPHWAGEKFSIGHLATTGQNGYNSTVLAAGRTVSYDHVRFFNGQLTHSQVSGLHSETSGSTSVPSLLWENCLWRMNSTVSSNESVETPADSAWWGDMQLAGGATYATDNGAILKVEGAIRKAIKARVEVLRINVDSTNIRTQDTMEWVEAQGITNVQLSHPGKALVGLRIQASEQLGGRIPNTTAIIKGTLNPTWNGNANVEPQNEYSANPAWCALAMILDSHWGLPGGYTANLPMLKEVADYADEVVYDGTEVVSFDGTIANAIGQNVWYDGTVTDAVKDTVRRGAIEVHIPYLSQAGSNPALNSKLPSTWAIGSFIRLRGFNNPALTDSANYPLDSADDEHGSGGYEIYETSIDSDVGSGLVQPAYHVIRAYYKPLSDPNPPTQLWGTQGFYVDGNGIDKSYGAAIDAVDGVIPFGGMVEGGHRRYEFNAVFDQADGGWDQLQKVLSVARAAPYRMGKEIGFRFSHKADPSSIITQSSITPGSFVVNYGAPSSRLNAFDFLIRDRFDSFNNDTITYVSPTVSTPTSLNTVRRDQRELFGVTSRGQASRQAVYEVNVNELLIRRGEYEVGPIGLTYEVGDILRVASDLLPDAKGQGGFVSHGDRNAVQLIEPGDFDMTGSAWTSNGALTKTAHSNSDATGKFQAYRIGDSSSGNVAGLSYTTQTGYTSGVYCVGYQAKKISGSDDYVKAELSSTEDSSIKYSMVVDLTDGSFGTERKTTDGGTQVTDIGDGFYYVQMWFKYIQASSTDTVKLKFTPAGTSTGATASGQGVKLIAGVSLTEGKQPVLPKEDGSGSTGGDRMKKHGFIIEQPITIDGTETVHVRGTFGQLSSVTGAITNQAGTYVAGDMILLDDKLAIAAERHNEYTFVEATAGGAIIEILGLSLGEGLKTKVSWIEYNEAVFNDRSENTIVQELSSDDHGGLDGVSSELKVPAVVSVTSAVDWAVRDTHGIYNTRLRLSWVPAREDRTLIEKHRIYARVSGRWQAIGEAGGADGFADLPLSIGSVGDLIDVAVQPVTRFGIARAPERCGRIRFAIQGYSTLPNPPENVTERVSGYRELFQWTLPENERGLSVELRRGGWILGQRVFLSPVGDLSVGPSEDWVGSDYSAVKLRYRSLTAAGGYSSVVEADTAVTYETDPKAPAVTEQSRQWETYGSANGWEATVPASGDPSIQTGFEQIADGSLRYTAGSTDTTASVPVWVSRQAQDIPTSGAIRREARNIYVEAYVEADQIHPDAWEDATATWRTHSSTAGTWEGPVTLLSGETQSGLSIEMNTNDTGSSDDWSGWIPYQPGLYPLVDIRFRLVASRPGDTFNIAVRKFHTRMTAPAGKLDESTPSRRLYDGELY